MTLVNGARKKTIELGNSRLWQISNGSTNGSKGPRPLTRPIDFSNAPPRIAERPGRSRKTYCSENIRLLRFFVFFNLYIFNIPFEIPLIGKKHQVLTMAQCFSQPCNGRIPFTTMHYHALTATPSSPSLNKNPKNGYGTNDFAKLSCPARLYASEDHIQTRIECYNLVTRTQ